MNEQEFEKVTKKIVDTINLDIYENNNITLKSFEFKVVSHASKFINKKSEIYYKIAHIYIFDESDTARNICIYLYKQLKNTIIDPDGVVGNTLIVYYI